MLVANPSLKNKIFNAQKFNQLVDALVSMERFYMNDVHADLVNFTLQDEYSASTEYHKGNIVPYGSDTYMCLDDCTGVTPGTDGTKWKIVMQGNITENRLVGDWDDDAVYAAGNCVAHNGQIWRATEQSTGVEPQSGATQWESILNGTDASAITGVIPVEHGGTGASSASAACDTLGALSKSGGTMTGSLFLTGAPTSDNMAANKKYIDDHKNNGTVHVTAAERLTWNGVNSNFNTHNTDETRHVTSADKANWNSKAPGYTYGTTDMTPGVSTLATGVLYFVYE